MYNLHSHSLISDGVLLPSEIAVRYLAAGYKVLAITDHADYSNIDIVIKAAMDFCRNWPANSNIKVFPGVELTHLQPEQFKPLSEYCRGKGIKIIVAHGETPVEPVIKGTNRAALEANIDILAHPGLISAQDTALAKNRGIFLELTSRRGHKDANKHVVRQALEAGARLILNNDSHRPDDIITPRELFGIGLEAGLSRQELEKIYEDVGIFINAKEGS